MLLEPFKTKVTEPIRLLSRGERLKRLKAAKLNLFNLASSDVYIDLLTDSGTGAMSQSQWAALMEGDESYAGSRSFAKLAAAVADLFGFPHVLPSHQGRSAELVLMSHLLKKGDVVPGNIHFDTTAAHIEFQGAVGVDLAERRIYDLDDKSMFKGNIDLAALESCLKKNRGKVPLCIVTATCNTGGGQPVALANIRASSEICRRHKVPLFIDAARVIENAFFIKRHEAGMSRLSIKTILHETMDAADGMIMSAKKDGIVNIGGFTALRDKDLYDKLRDYTILFDGFVTYGGLAGRDLAAMAVGLYEATELDYLEFRVGQVKRLGDMIKSYGITIVEPTGGHAVYIDGRSFCPHIKPERFPAHSLSLALYLEGGVRTVEVGYILRGRDPITGKNRFDGLDLLRLAVPRRVYTITQLDYVADVCGNVKKNAESIRGVRFTREALRLRHFVSEFEFA